MTWTWATASWQERGDFVRQHFRMPRPLSHDQARDLFNLTEEGLMAIINGDTWKPDYDRTWKESGHP